MDATKREVLLVGPLKPVVVRGLDGPCTLHTLATASDPDIFLAAHSHVRAIACSATTERIPGAFMERFPELQIVSSFGVGYDHMDVKWAAAHSVVLTNTPGVLTEEVADTALGLLLCTVREFPQANRYVRAGRWREGEYPLTRASLRNRTVGLVGMGAIGRAIARRLDAMKVPVVYHTRQKRDGLPYRHYAKLIDMARDVDILLAIVPGGAGTANMINADVLDALGPERHSDQHGARLGGRRAGLDQGIAGQTHPLGRSRCFRPGTGGSAGASAMENVVLLPHVGSGSVVTRERMDQLMVDNILAWAAGQPALTPVPETPWRSWA